MKKLKAALSRWRRKTGDSSVIANDDFVFLSDMKTHSDKDLPKQRLSIALGLYILSSASFLVTFFTLYDFPDWNVSPWWLGILVVSGAIFYSIPPIRHSKKIGWISLGIGALAVGFLAWFGNESILWGAKAIINDVIDRINLITRYFIPPLRVPAQYDTVENIHTCLILVLGICVFCTAYAVICSPNIAVFLLPTGATIFTGLAYELVPNYFSFILLLICYVVIAFLQVSTWKSRRKNDFTTYFSEQKSRGTFQNVFVSNYARREVRFGFGITCSLFLLATFLISAAIGVAVFSPAVYQSKPVVAVRKELSNIFIKKRHIDRWLELYNGQVSMTPNFVQIFAIPSKDLKVQSADLGQTLYLKGFVGASYEGDRWESIDKDRETIQSQSFSERSRHVQNIPADYIALNASVIKNPNLDIAYETQTDILLYDALAYAHKRFTYIPYQAKYPDATAISVGKDDTTGQEIFTDVPTEIYGDSTMFPRLDRFAGNYEFSYFATQSLLDTDMLSYLETAAKESSEAALLLQDEQTYRSFVHDYYTRLPENKFDQLKAQYTPQARIDSGSLSGFVEQVKADLAATATFSLNGNPAPAKGEDFIEHFLYTGKQGHSSHFASAAAIMFRSAGIPARYVEGYRIDPEEDIKKGDPDFVTTITNLGNGEQQSAVGYTYWLTGKNMHAWVEIYLDGFGWVPVEVTPGFSQQTEFDPALYQGEKLPEKENDFVPPSESGNVTSGGIAPSIGLAEAKYSTLKSRVFNISFLTVKKILFFTITIVICAALMFLVLRRYVCLQREKRRFYTDDIRRNTINLYRYLKKVLAFFDVSVEKSASYESYRQAFSEKIPAKHPEIEQDFANVFSTAVKVGFGDKVIDAEQMKKCLSKVQNILNVMSGTLGPLRRCKLIFLRAIW
ncbi:hypothetical protein H8K20_02495 [Neobittarella massiliensis]|uniref:Transglutaminase-like domain-containing protein n=1 Tax=Neobittarella massiliensis (ex Bilen et al. 2018) TaxID=2041842 RepID=A0A8J6IMZ9_9FIRM|nr:transglutaminase-like domain-containing protein [Neobittarella massiliensis]MBC3515263.1 hypothetical protein [Neobittarella massiliensis]